MPHSKCFPLEFLKLCAPVVCPMITASRGESQLQSVQDFSTGRLTSAGPDQCPTGQKDCAQFESSAAVRARGGLPGLELDFRLRDSETVGELDQGRGHIEADFAVGIQKSITAYFHESAGEHMLSDGVSVRLRKHGIGDWPVTGGGTSRDRRDRSRPSQGVDSTLK